MKIREERIQILNDEDEGPAGARYVLYWMQQAQRAEYNHALEYAVGRANALGQPCLVVFGLAPTYPEANWRHDHFMLAGLRETRETLAGRGIKLVVRVGSPEEVALEAAGNASLVVCDRGYLRHQKEWRKTLAEEAGRRVVQVESDVIVPVEEASDKREYAARTIRKKLQSRARDYLETMRASSPAKSSLPLRETGIDLEDLEAIRERLKVDENVGEVSRYFTAGTSAAKRSLRRFLDEDLSNYGEGRPRPDASAVSHMSIYLHFGQISPLWIAGEVCKRRFSDGVDAFLEELLVRRELAMNFVQFTPDYDRFSSLPDWARKTLEEHRDDPREHAYTRRQMEEARTHDAAWNAAMREMKATGYLHNHMRMYWGKQILAWSSTPEYAYKTALYLNNKYFLDGRDPNSYTNIGWLFGLHDRPWQEREVFGKVRIMTRSGLDRKCDVDAYIRSVDELAASG